MSTIKLPHQTVPTPTPASREAATAKYVDDAIASVGVSTLFQWNHADVSQFSLATDTGWTVTFVAASISDAEHILLTAPAWTTSAGYAYITTADLASANYEVDIIHGFPSGGDDSYLGIIGRFGASTEHVSTRWQQTPTALTKAAFATWKCESGVESVVFDDKELAPVAELTTVVKTNFWCKKNIIGGGVGRTSLLYSYTPAVLGSLSNKKIGFGVFAMTGTSGGGETVKIYDIVARST